MTHSCSKQTRRPRSQCVPPSDFMRGGTNNRRGHVDKGPQVDLLECFQPLSGRHHESRGGGKKTQKCDFFFLIAQCGASGSRKRRRTSGKHRYLHDVFERCVCSSEKIGPAHFFKMETEGAAEWDVRTDRTATTTTRTWRRNYTPHSVSLSQT